MSSARPSVSPHFAVDAARLLDAGDAGGAIGLCEHGIACYPDYATGYLVLARAYVRSGKPDAARSMAQLGLQHAPHSAALQAIVNAPTEEAEPQQPATNDSETEELTRLAERLEGAHIPPIDPTIPIPRGEAPAADTIVTPTLARIYEQQGLLDEAITAYKHLAALGDASKGKYEERIAAIEKKKAARGEHLLK